MKRTDYRKNHCYKGYVNVCMVGWKDPVSCYPSAIKFDTLTEARKYAKQYTNVYVYRVYLNGEENPIAYKPF